MFDINGEKWGILIVSPFSPSLRRSDGSFTIGVCNDNTKTIYIAEGLNEQLLKKVICHEITHAAMFSYNVELNLDQEEIIADLIATYGEEIVYITNKIFKKIEGTYYY